jgi:hypothetical protein
MVAVATELGDPEGIALALYCQADLPWSEGNFAEAARLYHEAAETATRVDSRSLAATIRRSEAEVLAEGDDSRLAASLDGVIDEFRAIDDPHGLTVTLAVLAGAELCSGATGSAATDRERVRAIAIAALGVDRYSALHAEGRGIPEVDAEVLALSLAARWEGPASSA